MPLDSPRSTMLIDLLRPLMLLVSLRAPMIVKSETTKASGHAETDADGLDERTNGS